MKNDSAADTGDIGTAHGSDRYPPEPDLAMDERLSRHRVRLAVHRAAARFTNRVQNAPSDNAVSLDVLMNEFRTAVSPAVEQYYREEKVRMEARLREHQGSLGGPTEFTD